MSASTKQQPVRIRRAAEQIGSHIAATRKLQRLTAQQLAERADITRTTLRNLERGEPTVGLDVLLNVARGLGLLDRLVDALDPFETDIGRTATLEGLPKRVRNG